MTCRRYNLPSLLATSCTLLLLLLLSSSSHAQPQKKQQDRPLPTIGDTLHQVCDKDKNSKVTMNEINTQLNMLEGLFTSVGQDNMNERESDYMEMFTAVRIIMICFGFFFFHQLSNCCLVCYVCMVTKRIDEGRCSTNIRIIRFQ